MNKIYWSRTYFHKMLVFLTGIALLMSLCHIVVLEKAYAQTVVISIPSTQPWTDTGLTVSTGDVIAITASGIVTFSDPPSPENTVGPYGKSGTGGECNFVVTDSAVAGYSLVGNITNSMTLDGKGFLVGSSFEGTIPISNTTQPTGKLFLGFNDGAVFCDRSGYWRSRRWTKEEDKE